METDRWKLKIPQLQLFGLGRPALGSVWAQSGISLGSVWDQSGISLGSVRGQSEVWGGAYRCRLTLGFHCCDCIVPGAKAKVRVHRLNKQEIKRSSAVTSPPQQ
uniref:Uncharacterized protein n=1 Tax=Knipowitschia caucasica TaxID=637954 RepID=A0AAV2J4U0_KNICA